MRNSPSTWLALIAAAALIVGGILIGVWLAAWIGPAAAVLAWPLAILLYLVAVMVAVTFTASGLAIAYAEHRRVREARTARHK